MYVFLSPPGPTLCSVVQAKAEEEEVDHTPWGELEPSDEESSEEEEEEESDEEKPDETGFITPADRYGSWSEEAELSGQWQNRN